MMIRTRLIKNFPVLHHHWNFPFIHHHSVDKMFIFNILPLRKFKKQPVNFTSCPLVWYVHPFDLHNLHLNSNFLTYLQFITKNKMINYHSRLLYYTITVGNNVIVQLLLWIKWLIVKWFYYHVKLPCSIGQTYFYKIWYDIKDSLAVCKVACSKIRLTSYKRKHAFMTRDKL